MTPPQKVTLIIHKILKYASQRNEWNADSYVKSWLTSIVNRTIYNYRTSAVNSCKEDIETTLKSSKHQPTTLNTDQKRQDADDQLIERSSSASSYRRPASRHPTSAIAKQRRGDEKNTEATGIKREEGRRSRAIIKRRKKWPSEEVQWSATTTVIVLARQQLDATLIRCDSGGQCGREPEPGILISFLGPTGHAEAE